MYDVCCAPSILAKVTGVAKIFCFFFINHGKKNNFVFRGSPLFEVLYSSFIFFWLLEILINRNYLIQEEKVIVCNAMKKTSFSPVAQLFHANNDAHREHFTVACI